MRLRRFYPRNNETSLLPQTPAHRARHLLAACARGATCAATVGNSIGVCPEKESELSELNVAAIAVGLIFTTFWLGAAFALVVFEPITARWALARAENSLKIELALRRGQVAAKQAADAFYAKHRPVYETATLPVIEAEDCE